MGLLISSAVGLVVSLAPIVQRWGVSAVRVTTMQALSGAGMAGVGLADAARGNDALNESLRSAYERLRNLTERLRQEQAKAFWDRLSE